MLKRIIVILFNNIYTTSDDPTRLNNLNNPRHKLRDSNLKDKLKLKHVKEELLVWLVKKAVALYSDLNFKQPLSIIKARESYLAENDKVQQYIAEYCHVDLSNKNYYILATDFRNLLNSSMSTNLTQIKLIETMKFKGFLYKYVRIDNNVKKAYMGLSILF